MPRPRQHTTAAARMAAYRQRRADAQRQLFLARCAQEGVDLFDAAWIADLLLPVGYDLALRVARAVATSQSRLLRDWHDWEQIRHQAAIVEAADKLRRR